MAEGGWLLRLAPPVLRGYLRLLRWTSRVREENAHALDGLQGPVLWAFWHNRLAQAIVASRRSGAGVVISRSGDGELISRVVAPFGYVPLRGSSSRGGAAALKAVLRHLRAGNEVAFTPDGPKGPRYRVQPGLFYVAQRTGLPVVPGGLGCSRKVVFSSWDRFQLPLPFARVQVCYGTPLQFGPGDDVAAGSERIRQALVAASERAEALLGVRSP